MTPGRPLQYDEAAVLEAAMQLFWSRGYVATSLQDLLDATGLSRSSFYQAFGSKRDLFLRCLETYAHRDQERMKSGLEAAPSGRAFLEAGFAALTGGSACDLRGCMLLNAANEFVQSDPEIAALVARGAENVRRVLTRAVERARDEGELDTDEPARAVADYLFAAHSGMITMAKAGVGSRRLKEAVRLVLAPLF